MIRIDLGSTGVASPEAVSCLVTTVYVGRHVHST